MIDTVHTLIGWAIAAPFVAWVLILVLPRRLTEPLSYAAAFITAACVALLLGPMRAGEALELEVFQLIPGVSLAFRADALGMTFALLASGLWVVTTLYSSGYARADDLQHRGRFFASFALAVAAAIGIAFSANLLTFFLFYEALTLSTYPLVVHKESPKAFAAGRRYLFFALGGGLALLTAIVATWFTAGTLDFVGGGILGGTTSPAMLSVLFALFMLGVGVKSGVMPLHSWLPAAMVAPTPVSALLHAVAVVKAGVFGVMRVIGFVFGPETLGGIRGPEILAALAMITIVVGSLIALKQDNLKRRLAYSTIVHLSYIVLGAALLTPLGMTGSVMHMVNHALAKITLFFCAGAIYATAHLENISEMRGLGKRMPWTFTAFTIGSLGLTGIPGLSGFLSKFMLSRGAVEGGDYLALAVMLGASLFTAAYLLPIVQTAFFPGMKPEGEGDWHVEVAEARPALLAPPLITSILVIVFGAVPFVIAVQYDLAARVALAVFGGTP